MSTATTTTTNGGIGFCGLLTIVFIVLKLIDKIQWSWWWVLAPTWIPIAIICIIALVCLCILGVCYFISNK